MSHEPLGRGSARHDRKKLHLLTLSEALIVEATPVLNKIPRAQRYRFGRQLEDALFELPRRIIEAASARTKTKVGALYDHVNYLDSLLRIGAELRLVSARFVGRLMQQPGDDLPQGGAMYQLGAMAGAWRGRVMSK